jgi:pilus assembly protein Flp/PilA
MVGQTAAPRPNCVGGETVFLFCPFDQFRFRSFNFSRGVFMLRKLLRDRKGQGLVEYALLLVGIAVVSLAAISELGHKTSDLMGTAAVLLPGAHVDDNNTIASGHLIETDAQGGLNGTSIEVSTTGVLADNGKDRLGGNLYGYNSPGAANGVGGMIIETQ